MAGSIMVTQRKPQRMTVDKWRELKRTSHDIKHEYIDGYIYAMSGGSGSHSRIGSNAVRTFEDALAAAGKSCSVYNSDVATRVSESSLYCNAGVPETIEDPEGEF